MRSVLVAAVGLVLMIAVPVPASAERGGYVIRSFDVDLRVQSNAELLVEERLVVDFREPRHGIYRTIPVDYVDPRGYVYSLGFRLVEVVDDQGRSHVAEVTRVGRRVMIRIGSSDVMVQGRVIYAIRYRVRNAVTHFAEHDELYWNATGHEWQSTIDQASAQVLLPGVVALDDLETAGYAGAYGSPERNISPDVSPTGGTTSVTYRTEGALAPLEGLTVAAAWPHGIVQFPNVAARVAAFLVENWILLMPVAAFGFLVHRYSASGRDPYGAGAVVVRYEPPEDLTPGEIGAILAERVDLGDITASVVDLAVRGYLRIRIEEEDKWFGLISNEETWFERLDKPREGLRGYERLILMGLFEAGDVISTTDLEHRFYKKLPDIRTALWEDLARRRLVEGSPARIRRLWRGLGIAAAVATIGIGYVWVSFRGLPLPHSMFLPVGSGIVVGGLFLLASRAMPRRTARGVAAREWALGFEEFVSRVERDTLEAHRRQNVFESLLPYAMALGVAGSWARQFEGIYERETPVWFHGGHSTPARSFSTRGFESSLSSAMSRAGGGMTATPRSSGSSGGGGFSGGGGGGGGGGSW